MLVNKNGDRMESYIQNFRWADDKYPVSTPLREMVDEIVQVSSWHRCSNALFLPSRKVVVAAVGLPVICLGPETHLHSLSSVYYLEASNESRGTGRSGAFLYTRWLPSRVSNSSILRLLRCHSSTVFVPFATVVSC